MLLNLLLLTHLTAWQILNFRGGGRTRFGERFARYFQPTDLADTTSRSTENQPCLRRTIRKVSGGGNVEIPDWDVAPEQEYFKELSRVSRNQVIWGANYFSMPPTRCFLVWDKKQPQGFSMAMCEYAWTSFNGNAKMFSMVPRRNKHSGNFHPTEKPIELYAWILKMFAHTGDRILDTHMGSQSSRIAAYEMGFDFVGCEIDPYYFKRGEERFQRECKGILRQSDGKRIIQPSFF